MIRVIDDYVIDSDGSQYISGRLGKSKKDGTLYIKDVGYHASMANAIVGISRRMRLAAIKDTNGDMKAACEAIRRCDERLIEAISQFDDLVIVSVKDTKGD